MTFVLEHTASHLSVLSPLALHLLAALMMAVHMSLLEHVSQVHQLPSVKQATVTAKHKKNLTAKHTLKKSQLPLNLNRRLKFPLRRSTCRKNHLQQQGTTLHIRPGCHCWR